MHELRYDLILNAAFLRVVRDILQQTAEHGLPGEHHFIITFRTTDPGVEMAPRLKDQHPDQLTICLQHQFEDLHVEEDAFWVCLVFNGQRERLRVPLGALTVFEDPHASFKLCFSLLEREPRRKDTIGEVVQLDAFRKPSPGEAS